VNHRVLSLLRVLAGRAVTAILPIRDYISNPDAWRTQYSVIERTDRSVEKKVYTVFTAFVMRDSGCEPL
jgi:hypothetical protein